MKKKLFYGITAGLLAAVMCVGLVACGGTDAKSVVGEELPEEQKEELWAAAFAEENFTNFKMVVSGSIAVAEGETVKMDMTVIVTEEGTYFKIPGSFLGADGSIEAYVEKTEDGGYAYSKVDGKWLKVKMSAIELESADMGKMLAESMLASFADGAERYEYSAEWKGYIVPDEPASLEAPVIKFKNGKIVAIYSEEEGGTQSLVLTYGGQSIKFPKATEMGE